MRYRIDALGTLDGRVPEKKWWIEHFASEQEAIDALPRILRALPSEIEEIALSLTNGSDGILTFIELYSRDDERAPQLEDIEERMERSRLHWEDRRAIERDYIQGY